MFFRNRVACGCHTLYEHERRNCTRAKMGNRGKAKYVKRTIFQKEHRSWDEDWAPGGILYSRRSSELHNVLIKGMEHMTLEQFAYEYDSGQDMLSILHQPPKVILSCLKLHCDHMKYTVRALDFQFEEETAQNWNILIDTLADPEVYQRLIGPIRRRKANEKLLNYKWEGPLTTFEQYRMRKREQLLFFIAPVWLQKLIFNSASEGVTRGGVNSSHHEAVADVSPPRFSRASTRGNSVTARDVEVISSRLLGRIALASASVPSLQQRRKDSKSRVNKHTSRLDPPKISPTYVQPTGKDVTVGTFGTALGKQNCSAPKKVFSSKKRNLTTEKVVKPKGKNTVMPCGPERRRANPNPKSNAAPASQRVSKSVKFKQDLKTTWEILVKKHALLGPPLATM